MVNKDKEIEIKKLQQKINYIYEHIELIENLKDYWIIILSLENKHNKYIFNTVKIYCETLYKRIGTVIDMFIKYRNSNNHIVLLLDGVV